MAKIIHYRHKCIGCGICYEIQSEHWRMSKKDGKATLLRSTVKKDVFVLTVDNCQQQQMQELIKACPVKIIKLL